VTATRVAVTAALAATAIAVSTLVGDAGAAPSAPTDQFHRSIWNQAQALIRRDHLSVPWDGRFSYSEKTEICLEVFNGTRHDIKWHHEVPSGFYLKICADGEYVVSDGRPLPHMQAY
jgi:hypothetical protein